MSRQEKAPEPINHLLEATKKYINQDTKELAFGDLAALGITVAQAIHFRDSETLNYISDYAQRMQSPAFIAESTQRATMLGIGMVASEAAQNYRPIPPLNEGQINMLREISENGLQIKSKASSTLDYLRRNHMIVTRRIGRAIFHEVTPFGKRAIEKISSHQNTSS